MGNAKGHPSYAAIGVRGLRTMFQDKLESGQGSGWARRVSFYFGDSDSELETHAWLGQVAAMREWIGSRKLGGIRVESFAIRNALYENSIPIKTMALRRDKSGMLKTKAATGLAVRANEHIDTLATAVLVANPLGYDGIALYSASHVSGASGTQTNLLTLTEVPALNVADTAAITTDEATAIMLGVVSKFYGFKDDAGQPANRGAKHFVFTVPVGMWTPFVAAANNLLTSAGGTNSIKNQEFTLEVVLNPELTTQTVGYCFRADPDQTSGLIIQEEVQPEFDMLDEGSEYAKDNHEIKLMAWCSRAVAAGQWRHTAKFTVS